MRAPIWRQTWHDLLFAHWPVPAATLRPLVPASLTIDEYDGTSWVGVIPFHRTGVTLRHAPALPWISAFAEMNCRVYVTCGDRPGVWFISLDAARALAVWTARALLGLPYFHAAMHIGHDHDDTRIRYSSDRRGRGPRVAFRATYGPTGPMQLAARGTLEHFLTERYCLYTMRPGGRLARLEIDHAPWPLQPANADIETNLVAEPQGIRLPPREPLLHFSKRLEVVGWGTESLASNF
jgi:uncharacterized protein YqjF (DUF2071 family)